MGTTSVVPPGALAPTDRDHYRVFTPYWRRWQAASLPGASAPPRRVLLAGNPEPGTLPSLRELTPLARSPECPRGGERAARHRLSRWLADGLHRYEREADMLAAHATSRLSPYLHFGCLSPREVVRRACERDGAAPFVRQLCWRDFFLQLLAANTGTTHQDLRPQDVDWNDDPDALARWREGQTGYPIVDAAMRQLAREGWISNRARLIAGSFLTRTLRLDWRAGACVFFDLLVDGDVANNIGNWQWVAGTGANPRPNRALNPIRQAARFDPHGDYVRQYVPELAQLPGATVHEPWRAARTRRVPEYPDRLDARAA
jgi:deoxyribodipyrimidine photo-lyase